MFGYGESTGTEPVVDVQRCANGWIARVWREANPQEAPKLSEALTQAGLAALEKAKESAGDDEEDEPDEEWKDSSPIDGVKELFDGFLQGMKSFAPPSASALAPVRRLETHVFTDRASLVEFLTGIFPS